jgi:acetyl esterase/lipase
MMRGGAAALAFALLAGEAGMAAEDIFGKRIVYSVPGMDRVQAQRDLTYRTDAGAELKMDVYVPPGLGAAERRPAVFFVHGGPIPPEMQPKDWGVFRSYGELAAASGLVGVTFNHRLYAYADYPRADEDVAAAVAFVRAGAERFHADPERTALWVFSGGGPLLASALRQPPSHLKALVSFYGLLDLRDEKDRSGVPPPEDVVRRFSPVTVVESGAPPFPPLMIGRAGQDGARINASVEAFTRAAWAKGLPLDVLNHPSGRHGFDIMDDDARSRERIRRAVEFLKTRLEP